MPLLTERTQGRVNTSGGVGESSMLSPTYSPTSPSPSSPYFFERLKLDPEEDQALFQKKSVLTKVKERAKKLRYTFSKRRQEDGNFTPSWGVSLDDDGEEEEDAEYLGAPMYESELAPEGYKENARQHPRANPVISEKHVLPNPAKLRVEQDQEKSLSPLRSTTTTQSATTTTPPPCPDMTKGSNQGLTVVSTTPSASVCSQTSSSSTPLTTQSSLSSSLPHSGDNTRPRDASVIYEVMSPRTGVMEKLRGAVNSLLRNEEPSQQSQVKGPTTHPSSQAINSREVGQEENHGGILQANAN